MLKGARSIFVFLILVQAFLPSCIKEGQEECVGSYAYELFFVYDGNGSGNIFDTKIDRVGLYLFGAGGELKDVYEYSTSELASFRGARLDLEPGRYTVVCWGNVKSYTTVTDETSVDDKRLYQSQFLSGQTVTGYDSVYYSRREITISPDNRRDTTFFRSSHINMEIYIEGYRSVYETQTRQGNPYLVQVTNAFAGYDFSMDVTGEVTTVYPGWVVDSTGEIAFSKFNLFRFLDENDIFINILDEEGNPTRIKISLEHFMRDHTITVEGINEITVPIYIITDGTTVHVKVAEWDTETVKPIFKQTSP